LNDKHLFYAIREGYPLSLIEKLDIPGGRLNVYKTDAVL
jgi:hypothetical protein